MSKKKIAFVLLSSILLGGCTLTDSFKTGNAAKDAKPEQSAVSASLAPTTTADPELSAMPSTSGSSDVGSLEADINSTTILEEDFSDLE